MRVICRDFECDFVLERLVEGIVGILRMLRGRGNFRSRACFEL